LSPGREPDDTKAAVRHAMRRRNLRSSAMHVAPVANCGR
jgi:hypothetical protein